MRKSSFMRYLIILAGVGALAAAAPPRVCQKTGLPPVLNGDPFSPVECSTAPKAALPLPEEPATGAAKPDFKELEGRWEALLIKNFGRYATTLKADAGWGGKAELRLEWKEQQTRQAGWTALRLAPLKKEPGAYEATLTASALPGATLSGTVRFSEETDKTGARVRRADAAFANGASHRLRWSLPDKGTLRFAAQWAVPEAPVQTLAGELKKAR